MSTMAFVQGALVALVAYAWRHVPRASKIVRAGFVLLALVNLVSLGFAGFLRIASSIGSVGTVVAAIVFVVGIVSGESVYHKNGGTLS
jgi:hypothetical protein